MTQVIKVNIVALLNIFDYRSVQIVNMHLNPNSPKQFEDSFGNLWYASELSNFQHIK